MNFVKSAPILFSLSIALGIPISAVSGSEVVDVLLQEYQQSSAENFSAQAGEKLWMEVTNERSCTTCHTTSVKNVGKHQRTGKIIQPMSPTINPQRLTDPKKVKKWLLRNCKWTYERECTSQEKGNILLWLSQQ